MTSSPPPTPDEYGTAPSQDMRLLLTTMSAAAVRLDSKAPWAAS